MKLQNIYKQQNRSEIERLITESLSCLLITGLKSSSIQVGVFNPILFEHKVYLHLSRGDEQFRTMKENSNCKLIFQDILGILPSHWVDEQYAGAATTYYRYAEIDSQVKLIEDPKEQIPFLEFMMGHFQPEGKYDPIDYGSPVYQKKLESILVAEFPINDIRAKWKIGQNRSTEERLEISRKFKERNLGNDHNAALEIERWIEHTNVCD